MSPTEQITTESASVHTGVYTGTPEDSGDAVPQRTGYSYSFYARFFMLFFFRELIQTYLYRRRLLQLAAHNVQSEFDAFEYL